MKWSIVSLKTNLDCQFLDGNPILNTEREGSDIVWRLSTPIGFLDFMSRNNKVYLNENPLLCSVTELIEFHLVIKETGEFEIRFNQQRVIGKLKSQPVLDPDYLTVFKEMINRKLVPYQNIPDEPGRSTEELNKIARQYFPHRDDAFLLAMAIYDWTTAAFVRIVIFTEFTYSALQGRPLDVESITDAIWTASWPPYTPKDKDFMASFLMEPAETREAVYNQLIKVAPQLYRYAQVQSRLIAAAIACLPPVPTSKLPNLYSGEVDISNLGSQHFATGFFEFNLNGEPYAPLEMDLKEALTGLIKPGKVISTKRVLSFTDTLQDAMRYQNGIILVAEPNDDDLTWNNTAYFTPFSDGPTKTEYGFFSGSRFLVKRVEEKAANDRTVTTITVSPHGYLDPDLVASNTPIPIDGSQVLEAKKNKDESKNENLVPRNTTELTPSYLLKHRFFSDYNKLTKAATVSALPFKIKKLIADYVEEDITTTHQTIRGGK